MKGKTGWRIALAALLVWLPWAVAGCGAASGQEQESAGEGAGTPGFDEADGAALAQEHAGEGGEPLWFSAGAAHRETNQERPALELEGFLTQEGLLDLEALRVWNEECYGWLDIVGTDMSFPIVTPMGDQAYYLSHNFFGDEDEDGCVYTEEYNSMDFSDPNTALYGRNRAAMFGRLHQYQDRDFFDANREIKIYLEDRVLTYRIFAAYTFDDRHIIMSYDFSNKNVFSSYLADVFSQRQMDAFLDEEMKVTVEDKIITLSTGVTGQDEKRYLVQAVLLTE